MQPSCLFCLEAVKTPELQNPIGCRCKLVAHSSCFDQWFAQKNQMECPICHTVSIPSPVAYENIQIVYVETTRAVRQEQQERRFRGHEKAVAFCCCLLMGWGIGFTILDIVFQSR